MTRRFDGSVAVVTGAAPRGEGVGNGMATALISLGEIRSAIRQSGADVQLLVLHDQSRELRVIEPAAGTEAAMTQREWPVGAGTLMARVALAQPRVSTIDRLMLLLPVLMWVLAALVTWLLVSRLLIRPLKHLERVVRDYHPGSGRVELPARARHHGGR